MFGDVTVRTATRLVTCSANIGSSLGGDHAVLAITKMYFAG